MRTSSGWLLVRLGVVLKKQQLLYFILNAKPTLKWPVVVHVTLLCFDTMSTVEQQAFQLSVATPRFERVILALKCTGMELINM